MDIHRRLPLPRERWRRLGLLNLALISLCCLILVIALVIDADGPVTAVRILYRGNCTKVNRMDAALHLIINIFSTCVLASSNFFMQVVSSPTRGEIDAAHRSLRSLEVGVTSIKNLGFLPWFKVITWVGLSVSSIPIHLLFNSVIYSTQYQGADWHLTIATDGFVNGTVDYYNPGAALAAAGSACPAASVGSIADVTCHYDDSLEGSVGYGVMANITDYWQDSLMTRSISKAATNASAWIQLDPSECFEEYRFCKPRQEYRDLVVVMNTTEPGFRRSELYRFSEASNLSVFWDPHIQADLANSLWYSTSCLVFRDGSNVDPTVGNVCRASTDDCTAALGDPSDISWVNTSKLQGDWTIPFRPSTMTIPSDFGWNDAYSSFTVKHCLAEPNPDYICKLGFAPALLLVVIVCIAVKVFVCCIILCKLTDTSLIVPGDAIASFVSRPDPITAGLASLDIKDSERLANNAICRIPDTGLFYGPRARRWSCRSTRFTAVISRAVWLRTYVTLAIGMAILSTGFAVFMVFNGSSHLKGSFGTSSQISINVKFSYLGALLTANTPQIILSFCYFVFNAFFTRLQAEKEWNSYSLASKPLRVSDPKGKQSSVYRLQLPLKYSLPLIGTSVLLHWILSNSIFIAIIEGGFWVNYDQQSSIATQFDVSKDSYVVVGVSGTALLILLVVSGTVCFLPLLFSLRKARGDMVARGTDTLVISAACHVQPVLARGTPRAHWTLGDRRLSSASAGPATDIGDAPGSSNRISTFNSSAETDFTPDEPLSMAGHLRTRTSKRTRQNIGGGIMDDEEQLLSHEMNYREKASGPDFEFLEQVARSPVRWGAVQANWDLSEGLDTDERVMHLGFGTEEHDVKTPEAGQLYI